MKASKLDTIEDKLEAIKKSDYELFFEKAEREKELDKAKVEVDMLTEKEKVLTEAISEKRVAFDLTDAPKMVYRSTITLYGEVYAEVDGKQQPVMVAMILNPKSRKGKILDIKKISSTYVRGVEEGVGKSEHIRKEAQKLIDTSDILYVDPNKKRTETWLRANGLQLPVGITKYDPISKVTYYDDVVKDQDKELGNTALTDAPKMVYRSTTMFRHLERILYQWQRTIR